VSVYGARTVKRHRRTKAEIEELREALYEIVAQYEPITVRGVFYQAATRGLVPKTDNEGYRPIQRELLKMRREGAIPWGWITDGSRVVFRRSRYGNLESYAKEVARNYRRDYWYDSDEYVEIWLEKEALRGVIFPTVVDQYGLDLYVTKGQPSVTYLYEAAEQIVHDERPTHIYVLSDHDPGGLRIFERIRRELHDFVDGQVDLYIQRIAVEPWQIELYDLPTRPGKVKDPNAGEFVEKYGDACVELDAISPPLLRQLVAEHIESHIAADQLRALKLAEEKEREGLRSIQDLIGGV
jgi:hypothetical protein